MSCLTCHVVGVQASGAVGSRLTGAGWGGCCVRSVAWSLGFIDTCLASVLQIGWVMLCPCQAPWLSDCPVRLPAMSTHPPCLLAWCRPTASRPSCSKSVSSTTASRAAAVTCSSAALAQEPRTTDRPRLRRYEKPRGSTASHSSHSGHMFVSQPRTTDRPRVRERHVAFRYCTLAMCKM